MILTKQTVITWASMDDQMNDNIESERTPFIYSLIDQEKTDGTFMFGDTNLVGIRPFIDEASAQEYIDFITQLATTHGCSIVSAVIEDYVQV